MSISSAKLRGLSDALLGFPRFGGKVFLLALVLLTGCGNLTGDLVRKPVGTAAREKSLKRALLRATTPDSRVEQASFNSPVAGSDVTEALPLEIVPEGLMPYETWTEQHVAADALGRIGSPAVPHLIQTLRHPDPAVRKAAAEVLARMGSEAKDAVPALTGLLDDDDPAVRKIAARTLGRIGPDSADAIPALMRTLVQPGPVIPASHQAPALQ